MQILVNNHLEIYKTKNGKKPFLDWLKSCDKTIKHRIEARLDRVLLGNLGDHKYLDQGVFELRFQFGAGYRIYYGNIENSIILLLCGGDKSTQEKDIKKAIYYWEDYLSR